MKRTYNVSMPRDYKPNWFKKYEIGTADNPARVNIEVENSIVLIDIESGGSGRTSAKNRTKLLKYVIGRVELFNPALKVIGYRYGNISNPELSGSRFRSVGDPTLVSDFEPIKAIFTEGSWYRFRIWLSSDDGPINFDRLLGGLQLIETDKRVARNDSEAHWPEDLNAFLHEFMPTLIDADREFEQEVELLLESDGADESYVGSDLPPNKTPCRATSFNRDPVVKANVLKFAHGICDLCTNKAPFINNNGRAYLEVHHVVPLANDGLDQTTNAVALCPNCHRRCHHSKDARKATEKLYEQVKRLKVPD